MRSHWIKHLNFTNMKAAQCSLVVRVTLAYLLTPLIFMVIACMNNPSKAHNSMHFMRYKKNMVQYMYFIKSQRLTLIYKLCASYQYIAYKLKSSVENLALKESKGFVHI